MNQWLIGLLVGLGLMLVGGSKRTTIFKAQLDMQKSMGNTSPQI